MTPTKPSGNEAKLRELIIYISQLCAGDDSFGSTKLNKLLFRSDFESFIMWGKPLTGVPYFALENGPAPRAMKRLLEMMKSQGDIDIIAQKYKGGAQHRVISRRPARTAQFTPSEKQLVERIVKQYWGQSGNAISHESHEFLGWKLAKLQEEIPYTVALVSDRNPTEQEIERGMQLQQFAEECRKRSAR